MRQLWYSVFMLGSIVLMAGCGPTSSELKQKTLSSMNVVADSWDGSAEFKSTTLDAYGNPIAVAVSKGLLNYNLEVRSHGPDSLPKNDDDLVVLRHKRHGENTLNKEVEKVSESVGRGAFRGVVQGAKEGLLGKSKNKGDVAATKD